MWSKLNKIIENHRKFILTTHVNPDGDGIGAACALAELLIQMGKEVRIICDSPIPPKLAFLNYHGIFSSYNLLHNDEDLDVLVVLDTNRMERIGRLAALIDKPGVATLCIDHHEAAAPFTKHLAIDPKACSVGAMVYSLYKESGYALNLRAATGIYVSIICDTGKFSYSSTSHQAHMIADECIKMGVDPELIHTKLYQHITLDEIKLFAMALQGMEIYLDNKVAVQQIRNEDCKSIDASLDLEHMDLEYIHDFNNHIENVQCFMLLRECGNNSVRVSLRSRTNLDISRIVRSLGGGGHANAAGLSWKGTLEDIKTRILEMLRDLFDRDNCKIRFGGQV